MKRITDNNCWYGSCLRVKDINNIGIIEFDCEMYEELKKYENFMEEYGFDSLDDLKEEEIIQENHILKKVYLSACKKLADVFGECPYSNMNLQMPDYCEEECVNNEKYLCWDKYFIKQAKGEKDETHND